MSFFLCLACTLSFRKNGRESRPVSRRGWGGSEGCSRGAAPTAPGRPLPEGARSRPGRRPALAAGSAPLRGGGDRGSAWQGGCAGTRGASGALRSLAGARSCPVRGGRLPKVTPHGRRRHPHPPAQCSPAAPGGRALGRRGRNGAADRARRARTDGSNPGAQPRRGRAAGHKPHFRRLPRCRATVRSPKAPGLPAGPARAFRAYNIPVPGAGGFEASLTPSPCPLTASLCSQHPCPPSIPVPSASLFPQSPYPSQHPSPLECPCPASVLVHPPVHAQHFQHPRPPLTHLPTARPPLSPVFSSETFQGPQPHPAPPLPGRKNPRPC